MKFNAAIRREVVGGYYYGKKKKELFKIIEKNILYIINEDSS